jgi:hypothetical protein
MDGSQWEELALGLDAVTEYSPVMAVAVGQVRGPCGV